jgi:pimeloyl-ACP methyl ester carboxylesterase
MKKMGILKMLKTPGCLFILLCCLLFSSTLSCQHTLTGKPDSSRIISGPGVEELMKKPLCLDGYRPNQSGPLSRIDAKPGEKDDSTFTVEKIKIPSDGFLINGWLYLPEKEGKFPLIVLTNGGGDGSRAIKSLSDFIAPILAHCGYAAFVHDKRGTGESEGDYVKTTYDDYIADAGNCALFLSKHRSINPEMIGVLGGSEGGRIAVLAASRFPVIKFVISFAGTVVSMEEDRIYAQMGAYKTRGYSDSLINIITPLWKRSFEAWASNNTAEHEKVNKEIFEWRKKYDREILPFTKEEMDSIPEFRAVLPTWYSMPNDYLTELEHFRKKWLAIFGEVDKVVPTEASVKNIIRYMGLSGNKDYKIVIIPRCGHAPVDVETKRMIRIDNLIINWLNENVVNTCRK